MQYSDLNMSTASYTNNFYDNGFMGLPAPDAPNPILHHHDYLCGLSPDEYATLVQLGLEVEQGEKELELVAPIFEFASPEIAPVSSVASSSTYDISPAIEATTPFNPVMGDVMGETTSANVITPVAAHTTCNNFLSAPFTGAAQSTLEASYTATQYQPDWDFHPNAFPPVTADTTVCNFSGAPFTGVGQSRLDASYTLTQSETDWVFGPTATAPVSADKACNYFSVRFTGAAQSSWNGSYAATQADWVMQSALLEAVLASCSGSAVPSIAPTTAAAIGFIDTFASFAKSAQSGPARSSSCRKPAESRTAGHPYTRPEISLDTRIQLALLPGADQVAAPVVPVPSATTPVPAGISAAPAPLESLTPLVKTDYKRCLNHQFKDLPSRISIACEACKVCRNIYAYNHMHKPSYLRNLPETEERLATEREYFLFVEVENVAILEGMRSHAHPAQYTLLKKCLSERECELNYGAVHKFLIGQ